MDLGSGTLTVKECLTCAREKVAETFIKVFPYIVIGVAIGAVIHNWVSQTWIEVALGGNNPLGVEIAVILGVSMYADILGTAPVAEALLAKGALLELVLSFMIAVNTLSLPSMVMLQKG